MRSTREGAARTRARILAHARLLLADDRTASVRAVAAAAGVTIGAVYHYWPSREALLREASAG